MSAMEYRVVWRRAPGPWLESMTKPDGSPVEPPSESERTRRRIFQSERAALAHVERMRTAKEYFESMGRDEGGRGIEVAELEYIRVDARPVDSWIRGEPL